MATILVVDDSSYARRLHRQILEQEGHTVREAASGMSALESYFLERPEVVLLDLTMEDVDGFDVLRRLRDIDPQARVIVISADVQRSTASMVMEAGARKFLGKPVDSAELVEALNSLLDEVAR